MNEAFLVPILIALIIFVVCYSLFGALILRASVDMYNKIFGRGVAENIVAEPPFGKAFSITFISSIVQGVVGIIVSLALSTSGYAPNPNGLQLALTPIGLIIVVVMLKNMLPATWKQSMLITLCFFIASAAIVALITVIMLFTMRR